MFNIFYIIMFINEYSIKYSDIENKELMIIYIIINKTKTKDKVYSYII